MRLIYFLGMSFICIVARTFFSCEGRMTSESETGHISQDEAQSILFETYFSRPDPAVIIYSLDTLFLPGDTIFAAEWPEDTELRPISSDRPQWLFFVDNYYLYATYDRPYGFFIFIDYTDGSTYLKRSCAPSSMDHFDTLYYQWKRQNLEYPVLAFSDSIPPFGCGNFRVYIENADQNAVIRLEADTSKLHLSESLHTFDLKDLPDGFSIGIDFYYYLPPNAVSLARGKYCNDVYMRTDPPRIFNAGEGQVSIRILPGSISENVYEVNFKLNNILFRDDGGRTVLLEQYEASGVVVGWFPG